MRGLFNSENWFWQRMGELADVMLLSLLWLVCCIPVVTIGPSTAALNYVMLKKVSGEDMGVFRPFFRAFRQSLKAGIVIGVIMTAVVVLLYVDIRFYAAAEGVLRPLFGSLTVVGGAVCLLLLPYLAGMVAWFNNTVRGYFVSAFYLSLRHLLRSLLMAGICAASILAAYLFPPLVILSPGLAALGCASVLIKIFDRYAPREETEVPTDEE